MSEQLKLEQVVDEALAVLTERERTVLELRYGYNGKPVTQRDIGIEFGVSSSRIGQIEEKALRKIRYSNQIKELYQLHHNVLSKEDNFYARLFIKVFKLNRDLILKMGQPIKKELQEDISPSSSIESLRLSIRSFDCLMRAGVHTVQELLDLPYEKLCKIKNLNEKSLEEINEKRKTLLTIK